MRVVLTARLAVKLESEGGSEIPLSEYAEFKEFGVSSLTRQATFR